MPVLTGKHGPLQCHWVLMTKLTQVDCQPLTRKVLYQRQNWHILTQDNWVLQVIQGYQIDLTPTPYQVLQPPPIQLSKEKPCYGITGDTGTPDKRGNSGDHTIPRQFYLPNLSDQKERGRLPPCNQPQMLESICQGGTLQDGRATPPPRSYLARGPDDEAGSQGYIPPHSYSPRPSTPPPIHFVGETLQVQCLSFGLSAAPEVFTELLKLMVGFLR